MTQRPKTGSKVRILSGAMTGMDGFISYVNTGRNTITVMISGNKIHPADRRKFFAKRIQGQYYIPIVLMDKEWELIRSRTSD